jgi:hypothetical protein
LAGGQGMRYHIIFDAFMAGLLVFTVVYIFSAVIPSVYYGFNVLDERLRDLGDRIEKFDSRMYACSVVADNLKYFHELLRLLDTLHQAETYYGC